MKIENVSNKIVSLGPDLALLPDETTEVSDALAVALEPYIAVGHLKVKKTKAVEKPGEPVETEAEAVSEEPKKGRKKSK